MSSTALSVSVTKSDAMFLDSDQPIIRQEPASGQGMDLRESKFSRTGNVQFFFVSTVEGLADTIICPAFLATPRRTSWISFRFGSPILHYLAVERWNGGDAKGRTFEDGDGDHRSSDADSWQVFDVDART